MKKIILIILFGLFFITSCLESNDNTNIINEVSINVNYTTYEVSSNDERYTATYIKDNNYINFIIEIVLNDNLNYGERVKLIINDEIIEEQYYSIIDNKTIKYKIKDPNWTPFY